MMNAKTLVALSALTQGAVLPHAATAADLRSYIASGDPGTVRADFYWPFENSFLSDLQTMASRQRASGYEIHGIRANGCPPPAPSTPTYGNAEYFPILPHHMTRVARSTALIFGETQGDLAPSTGDQVDRYVQLALTNQGLTVQPLQSFGMDAKNEWTLHVVVSPDEDGDDERAWETVFDIGDPNHTTGGSPTPVRVTVELDRQATGTVFRVVTEAQGFPARVASTTVPDTDVETVNGRRWYQVIVQYYEDHANGDIERIRLLVNTVNASTGDVDTASAWTNSNEWRPTIPSAARVGLDLEDANPFHGAMHHLAVWKKLLDTDYDVSTELGKLGEAFATTYDTPDPRPEFAIDWEAEPRVFMWDRPIRESAFTVRDMRNWKDPLWDRDGVYPLVRFFSASPSGSDTNTNITPPTVTDASLVPHSWSKQPGNTPADVGRQTANWLEYLEIGLNTYAGKSLSDTDACALLWQNWGSEPWDGNDPCYYTDRGAARSLMWNWRDTPSIWRDAASHPYLPDTDVGGFGAFGEIHAPYYREGMSVNAFRSKDAFIELRKQIESRGLPTPARLHFDTERNLNVNEAWKNPVCGVDYVEGWWETCVPQAVDVCGTIIPSPPLTTVDPRSYDVAHWTPPSVATGGLQTIAELGAAFPYAIRHDRYDVINGQTRIQATGRFFRDQYDYAFGAGLLLPAVQELNASIRMSEYSISFAGDSADSEVFGLGRMETPSRNTQLQWFDFSSPVLYPVGEGKLRPGTTSTDDTLFQQWGTRLGVNHLLQTDDLPLNGKFTATVAQILEDHRIVYVERAKHMLHATYLAGSGANDPGEGAPTVPWIVYPGYNHFSLDHRFDIDGDGVLEYGNEDDTLDLEARWEDVARVAVFAHRRGVREFIFWGDLDRATEAEREAIPELLELVLDRIEFVRTRPTDVTTTGHVTMFDAFGNRNDLYGVPDGVVDMDDLLYFQNALTAGDIEADFSGPNGHPDGLIDNTYDVNDFGAQWLIDLYI